MFRGFEKESRKANAYKLRSNGYSYNDIEKTLGIAKSTLSYWFRKEDPKKLKEVNKLIRERYLKNFFEGQKKRAERIKTKALNEQQKYSEEISSLTKEDFFWLGLGLYWAEGGKTAKYRAVFYNSDPTINKVMVKFYREILKVPEEKIKVQLVLHRNITEEKARDFWSNELKIPKKNFFRASFVISKASKGKRPKNRLPYGTIQLTASGKIFSNKIKGWLLGTKKQIEQAGVVQQ